MALYVDEMASTMVIVDAMMLRGSISWIFRLRLYRMVFSCLRLSRVVESAIHSSGVLRLTCKKDKWRRLRKAEAVTWRFSWPLEVDLVACPNEALHGA